MATTVTLTATDVEAPSIGVLKITLRRPLEKDLFLAYITVQTLSTATGFSGVIVPGRDEARPGRAVLQAGTTTFAMLAAFAPPPGERQVQLTYDKDTLFPRAIQIS